MPTIEQFAAYVQALIQHDWHYDYSDDQRVWERGHREHHKLLGQAQCHSIYRDAYQAQYELVHGDDTKSLTRRRDQVFEDLRTKILSSYPIAA